MLVTGAAGSIGSAIATRLADEGASLYVSDLDRVEVEALRARLGGGGGTVDLSDDDSIVDGVDAAVSALGGLDAVVNAAAISRQGVGALEESTAEWHRVLQANLVGPYRLAQAACSHLPRGGAIINISSSGADAPLPRNVAYGASKAALNHLTTSLARHLAPEGIRVNAVSPGLMEMPVRVDGARPEARRGMDDRVPLGRLGQGRDVAGAVAYLLSADGDWITGQVIRINGGMS